MSNETVSNLAAERLKKEEELNKIKQEDKEKIDSLIQKGRAANDTKSSNITKLKEILQFGNSGTSTLIEQLTASKRSALPQASQAKATPAYNVRTPYMEVALNGIPIYPVFFPFDDPNASIANSDEYQNRQNVQNLTLSFPLSADNITITGNIKIFTKDPTDILTILDPDFPVGDSAVASSGLPTARVRFGWMFAEGSESTKALPLVSDELIFLVTGINLSDVGPGAGGFMITLTLQDQGSALINNSSGDVYICAGKPQDQLKTLIEGYLNTRLFTLDDLFTSADGKSTFFVSMENAGIRTNSDVISTVAEDLAARINCRWYSENTGSDEKADKNKLANEERNLRAKLNDLNSMKKANPTDPSIKKQIDATTAQISSRCRLYYVPNWPTTGKYATSPSWTERKKAETEVGAFLLLPEELGSPDIGDSTLPVIYGPGASPLPYLHGSAINVFNTMLEASSLPSQTFGDIISINASYASLLTEMKAASSSENISTKEIGIRLAVDGVVKSNKALAFTAEQEKQIIEKKKEKADNVIKYLAKIGKKGTKERLAVFARLTNDPSSLRWRGSAAHRSLMINDKITQNDKISGIDRTTQNFYPSSVSAKFTLVSRLSTFLQYPHSVSMVIPGDPSLLPLGIGCFEILSYLPSEIINGKVTQKLNPFLTGIYTPNVITHSISSGSFTTTIQGTKIPDAATVSKSSFTAELLEAYESTTIQTDTTSTQNKDKASSLSDQVLNIDLNQYADNPFLTGKGSVGGSDPKLKLTKLLDYIQATKKS